MCSIGSGVYCIYAIGDGTFLFRVLDALAAFANTGSLATLGAIGVMFGMVTLWIGYIAQGGQRIEPQWLIIGLVLWMVLFGPRVTVVVHEVNRTPGSDGQQSRVVDNVPFGAAFFGSIVSGLGVRLTKAFELAFSVPEHRSLTNGGVNRTLSALASIRALEMPYVDARRYAGASTTRDYNTWRDSLIQYIRECTIPYMQARGEDKERIFRSADPYQGIRAGSSWLSTGTLIGPDMQTLRVEETVTCDEALNRLRTYSAGDPRRLFGPVLTTVFRSSGGMDRAWEEIQSAYANLFGMTGQRMHDYMVASAIAAVWEQAKAYGPPSDSDIQIAAMMASAREQRNVQWAAEETMFRRIATSVVAFFEAAIYAIMPFMAILVTAGRWGLSLISRQVLLAVWVQLWWPILAIVGLYQATMIEHSARWLSNAAQGGTGSPTSVLDAVLIRNEIMDWLGTGAMLAAATPAISLMLIFGAAVTATYLAGRLQGTDVIRETNVAPDVVATSSFANVASFSNTSYGGSTVTQGAAMPSLTFSHALSYNLETSYQKALTAADRWGELVARAATQDAKVADTVSAALGNSTQGTSEWIRQDVISEMQKAATSAGFGHAFGSATQTELQTLYHATTQQAFGAKPNLQQLAGVISGLIGRTTPTGAAAATIAGQAAKGMKRRKGRGRQERQEQQKGILDIAGSAVSASYESSEGTTESERFSATHNDQAYRQMARQFLDEIGQSRSATMAARLAAFSSLSHEDRRAVETATTEALRRDLSRETSEAEQHVHQWRQASTLQRQYGTDLRYEPAQIARDIIARAPSASLDQWLAGVQQLSGSASHHLGGDNRFDRAYDRLHDIHNPLHRTVAAAVMAATDLAQSDRLSPDLRARAGELLSEGLGYTKADAASPLQVPQPSDVPAGNAPFRTRVDGGLTPPATPQSPIPSLSDPWQTVSLPVAIPSALREWEHSAAQSIERSNAMLSVLRDIPYFRQGMHHVLNSGPSSSVSFVEKDGNLWDAASNVWDAAYQRGLSYYGHEGVAHYYAEASTVAHLRRQGAMTASDAIERMQAIDRGLANTLADPELRTVILGDAVGIQTPSLPSARPVIQSILMDEHPHSQVPMQPSLSHNRLLQKPGPLRTPVPHRFGTEK